MAASVVGCGAAGLVAALPCHRRICPWPCRHWVSMEQPRLFIFGTSLAVAGCELVWALWTDLSGACFCLGPVLLARWSQTIGDAVHRHPIGTGIDGGSQTRQRAGKSGSRETGASRPAGDCTGREMGPCQARPASVPYRAYSVSQDPNSPADDLAGDSIFGFRQ